MNRICTKDKNWTEFGCCVITECKGRPNANQCVLTTKRSTNNWFLLQCHSNDRPAVEQGIVVPHANGVRKRLTIYSCTMCMKASVAVIWQSFVAANENECKLRDSQTTVLRSQARADNISICSELSQSLCNTPIRRQAYHTHTARVRPNEKLPRIEWKLTRCCEAFSGKCSKVSCETNIDCSRSKNRFEFHLFARYPSESNLHLLLLPYVITSILGNNNNAKGSHSPNCGAGKKFMSIYLFHFIVFTCIILNMVFNFVPPLLCQSHQIDHQSTMRQNWFIWKFDFPLMRKLKPIHGMNDSWMAQRYTAAGLIFA